jgi:DHA2 family multidrug resistance protein
MPTDKSSSIAGIVNFMRNIGSSVGTSMVTTIIARRSQIHQVYLAANVTPGATSVAHALSGLTARMAASGLDAVQSSRVAYAILYRSVILQATTLAYVDAFMILAVIALVMSVLALFLKKNQLGGHRVMVE